MSTMSSSFQSFGVKARNVVVVVIYLLCLSNQVQADLGLLYAQNDKDSTSSGLFCVAYNPGFHELPKTREEALREPFLDLMPQILCEDGTFPNMHSKCVAVQRGNCTFSEKARIVQGHQGRTALVVSKEQNLDQPSAANKSDYDSISIAVAIIHHNDYEQIKTLGSNLSVWLYSPDGPKVDYNMFIIWTLAVGTLVIGAEWSGRTKHKQRKKSRSSEEDVEGQRSEEEDDTFDLSPKVILIFVVLMCGMIVALYFLYDYLVYVLIGLFVIASSCGLYFCLEALMSKTSLGNCRIPPNNLPVFKYQPEIRAIILAIACLGLGIFWAIERKASYAWIFQDILGVAFCINMLKTVRLPHFMGCVILLGLLLLYDVFFVFITPLLTKSGDSIMVDVATGGSSRTGEQLPMVLKIPHLSTSEYTNICPVLSPYSLLGFGDIIVPGLLVAYCYAFDLKVQSKRIYFISTTIAYGLGLIICFMALAFMEIGQPALLYLVPCTVGTTVVIGWARGELRHLWKGDLKTNGAPQNSIQEPDGEGTEGECHQDNLSEDETRTLLKHTA
ncbi:signal peptide peptidase-like 2B [Lingula anatina]|uniref:Signal peptide peptidase-like 2B n=1 Tax=Lingula anatina TaxID=7574 RepID=A0A1S3H0V5_LINAN|nr:signal peptide peptidase-like 2B [Lingula anatina]|eukprot:XP_013379111.1 signal peptide peptidase-like 2B [Lingula anatina]